MTSPVNLNRRAFGLGALSTLATAALSACGANPSSRPYPGSTSTNGVSEASSFDLISTKTHEDIHYPSAMLSYQGQNMWVSTQVRGENTGAFNGVHLGGEFLTHDELLDGYLFLNGASVLANGELLMPAAFSGMNESALLFLEPNATEQKLDFKYSIENYSQDIVNETLIDEVSDHLYVIGSNLKNGKASDSYLEVRSLSNPDQVLLRQYVGINATSMTKHPDGSLIILSSGNERELSATLTLLDPETGADYTITLPEVMAQVHGGLTTSPDGRFVYVGTVDEFGQRNGEFLKVDILDNSIEVLSLNEIIQDYFGEEAVGGFHSSTLWFNDKLIVADHNNQVVFSIDPYGFEVESVYPVDFNPRFLKSDENGLLSVAGVDRHGVTQEAVFRLV